MLTNTEFKAVTGCNKISAYQLTTGLLRGGLAKLDLNPTATITLLYLCSCYNGKGKAVYPRIETIAENTGLSSSGVKKAIAELVQKGCILKAKKHNGTNSNIYTITNKVFESISIQVSAQKEPKRDTVDTNKSTCCVLSCNKKSDNIKKLDKKIRDTKQKISDKDLGLLKDFIDKNTKIINKVGYLKKLLSSDTTLLLKRLRAEKQAVVNAEIAVKETKELLENYKRYKAESSAPTAFYEALKNKTLAKIAKNQI